MSGNIMIYSNATNKFPRLEWRAFIAVITSMIFIIADGKFNIFLKLKEYTENSVCTFYLLYDKPRHILNDVLKLLIKHKQLITENKILHQELFLKNSELLLIDQYQKEIYRLNKLLNSPLSHNKRKKIAKIIPINTDIFSHQVIMMQGSDDAVYVGQPVITDLGIVGQVISVNKFSSRVLLICDPTHALSVQIKRNDVRMILMGNGYNTDLYAEYPGNIDVCIGDVFITSGLDGLFPEGYPVAIVSNIKKNQEQDITTVLAHPIVKLQCLRDVILIWD